MKEQPGKNREIVYGDCNGELIFLPKDLALELAQIHTALNTSKTWAEFKANVPAHVYEEVIEGMKDDEDPEALPQSEDAVINTITSPKRAFMRHSQKLAKLWVSLSIKN